MLWLYLDFYTLQLDALDSSKVMSRNQLTPPPEVIIIVDPKKNEVVQANQHAQAHGVNIGMGLATALSLHHDVNVLEYKPDVEYRRLQQLAQTLYQFTADIALSYPHGMYLRIDNMLCLYQGLDGYWQQVERVLQTFALHYHFATGSTPLMAKLLAQAQFNQVTTNTESCKAKLLCLPIEQLELEVKTQHKLQRVGVKQTKQLLTLPLKEMAKRFDIHLLNYIGKLLGEFKHGLVFYQPPAEFHVDIELLFEIENSQVLQHPIKRLLVQLEEFLRLRGLVTQQVTLYLKYRYNEFLEVNISRAQGEYQMTKWLSLIRLKLEHIVLSEPVVTITLKATQLRPLTTDSRDLFHNKVPQVSADELVAVMQAKLGDDKVQTIGFENQHHPCLTTHYQDAKSLFVEQKGPVQKAFTKTTPKGSQKLSLSFDGQVKLKLRPSLMAAISHPLKEHVTILQGPERLQTSWWHEHSCLRDYFVARNEHGRLCWIYRTPQKEWFLQGYFA